MASEDERALRDALEAAQQENKRLRSWVAELTALNHEALLARIKALEADNVDLHARLERADEVRVDWDHRAHQLRRELDTARQEQERLRSLLENERLSNGR